MRQLILTLFAVGCVEQQDGGKWFEDTGDGSATNAESTESEGETASGTETGGDATSGTETGGETTSGTETGGETTGGTETGSGTETGGESTGGEESGGEDTGGDATGGGVDPVIGAACHTTFADTSLPPDGVFDCGLICVQADWAVPVAEGGLIGDGFCDDAERVYAAHFHCEAFEFDAGDCSVAAMMPDFSLENFNPTSPMYGGDPVSPRELIGTTTGWYFTHASWGYCRGQYGHLNRLQDELMAEGHDVQLLAINEIGYSGLEGMSGLGDVPVLQDTTAFDVWETWDVTFRDVVILDTDNRKVRSFNLTENNLGVPANYAALKAILVASAE